MALGMVIVSFGVALPEAVGYEGRVAPSQEEESVGAPNLGAALVAEQP